jgi:hypothetical protein
LSLVTPYFFRYFFPPYVFYVSSSFDGDRSYERARTKSIKRLLKSPSFLVATSSTVNDISKIQWKGLSRSLRSFRLSVFLLPSSLVFWGKLISGRSLVNIGNWGMIVYAANPDTIISPRVILTLGSVVFILSMVDVLIGCFLGWERRLAHEADG